MHKKCPYCGSVIPEEALFCLHCFSSLVKTSNNNIATETNPLECEHENKRCCTVPHNSKLNITTYKRTYMRAFFIFLLVASMWFIPADSLPVLPGNNESPISNNDNSPHSKSGFFSSLFGEKEKSDDESEQLINETLDSANKADLQSTLSQSNSHESIEGEKDATNSNSGSYSEGQENPGNDQENPPAPEEISNLKWEKTNNNKIKITGCSGNASTIKIPAYIDGAEVTYLGENAFSDNTNIRKIVFEGTVSGKTRKFYLPYNISVFSNLPNLESITFPYETNNYMADLSGTEIRSFSANLLFNKCPKLSGIYFTPENANPELQSGSYHMFSKDGVLFTNTDSNITFSLLYYPPGKLSKTYSIPDGTYQIEKNAFQNNLALNAVNFPKTLRYKDTNFFGCNNLKTFSIDEGNKYGYYVVNDILYSERVFVNSVKYYGFTYPPGKADIYFEIPIGKHYYIGANDFCGNSYLQTLKCPSGTRIDTYDLLPDSLAKIIMKRDDPDTRFTDTSKLSRYHTVEYY